MLDLIGGPEENPSTANDTGSTLCVPGGKDGFATKQIKFKF